MNKRSLFYRFLLFVFLCSLAGCSKEKDALDPEIVLSPTPAAALNSSGDTHSLVFTANTDWSITVLDTKAESWCSVAPSSGKAGTATVVITVQPNPSPEDRNAEIRIEAGGLVKSYGITQKRKGVFVLEKREYTDIPAAGDQIEVEFETNLEDPASWLVEVLPEYRDWLYAVKTKALVSRGFRIDVWPNSSKEARTGKVIVQERYTNNADTITFVQLGGAYHYDREVVTLQKASSGNVNLVLIGDGFTEKDLLIEGGKYIETMRQASDYFFDIEPYRTYRDHFNVYAVCAVSQEEGVSTLTSDKNTKFSVRFDDAEGAGTAMSADYETVFDYAGMAPVARIEDCLVILVANSPRYGGTTWSWTDGSSIAICPMIEQTPPNDFKGVLQHEAGGHGFGRLADEYVYYNTTIPAAVLADLKRWTQFGHNANIEFTDDPAQMKWRHYFDLPDYTRVGAYEGASTYAKGIWRAESNSCMNNNVPYYNTPSREAIVRRIMELSGKDFDFDDFVAKDAVVISVPQPKMAPSSAASRPMPPFAPPVLREGSPRRR